MREQSPLARAREACERLGYQLTTPEDAGTDAIAWPGVDARAVPGGRYGPRPMSVELLGRADPETVLATVARAMRWSRTCLIVPPDADTADSVASVLAGPVGAREEDELGCRSLYTAADRVHLAEGGLALLDAGGPRPEFEWFEEPADGDDHRLVLSADGEVVAALPGTDALCSARPETAAFGHRYRREDDQLFHVYDADGREVGVFSGVTAMRDRGFHPVPAPVVPEHVLPGPAASAWAVLDPDRDSLRVGGGELELPEDG